MVDHTSRAIGSKAAVRDASVDLLKIGLAIMVAGLHANVLADRIPEIRVLLANGLFRIAVPTFFLISGFYFERQLALRGARWFGRIATMWAIWTMVYAGWWFDFRTGVLLTSLAEVLKGWLHLWYLVGLVVGAGVFVALRRLLPSSHSLLILAVLFFACGVTLQYAGRFDAFGGGIWAIRLDDPKYTRNGLLFGFPFLTFGVLMARHSDRLAAIPGKPMILAAGIVALIGESWIATRQEAMGNDMYFSLAVVCPVMFALVQRVRLPGRSRNLGHVATCIFLMHPLFQITLQAAGAESAVVFAGSVVGTILLSPIMIWLNRRVPLL